MNGLEGCRIAQAMAFELINMSIASDIDLL